MTDAFIPFLKHCGLPVRIEVAVPAFGSPGWSSAGALMLRALATNLHRVSLFADLHVPRFPQVVSPFVFILRPFFSPFFSLVSE